MTRASTTTTSTPRPHRSRWAAAAVTAAALTVAGLGATAPAQAAAPAHSVVGARPTAAANAAVGHSPKASAVLRSLAATAAAQPALRRTGRYEYIKVRGWYAEQTVGADGKTPVRLDRSDHEQWIANNGSGRIRRVDNHRVTIDQRFGPDPSTAPQKLPTTSRALQALLAESHPPYGTYEWFVAVNDVWGDQIVSPGVESALLRMLAGKPGMVDRGMVTDLLGRRGVAISTDSNHSRHVRTTLVFDVHTGALLDFDQHRLTAAGKPSPALSAVDYTAWMREGYTTTVTRHP